MLLFQACKVKRANKDYRGQRVIRDHTDLKAIRAIREYKVQKDQRVILESLAV
jgi:hypothetical protein